MNNKIRSIPRNQTEWVKAVWKFCRENCAFSGRVTAGSCTNEPCQWYPVHSMPRQQNLEFDFSKIVAECIELAVEVGLVFTVADVREKYRARHGNGDGLTSFGFWGNLAKRREWLDKFEICGEMVSKNDKSHSDKVKIWKKKGN